MKAIIIAAGKGTRLRPYTEKIPKCLVRLGNKTILSSQIEVFNFFKISNINIITGYKRKKIKFKNLKFFYNKDYKKNNILCSLFFAKSVINGNCIISYSDIIFNKIIIKKILRSKADISIVADINWKKNYLGRTLHPISEAENVYFNSKNILESAGKHLKSSESNGEFIGLLKLNSRGCEIFKKYYLLASKKFKNKSFYNAKVFEKAYLTDFFNYLIDNNVKINCIKVKNNWMEIDTVQDYKKAQKFFEK